jgi:hypothetical protein
MPDETEAAQSEADAAREHRRQVKLAASLMARAQWETITPEQRSALGRKLAAKRKTPAQMGAAARDPHKPRCPCGAMTLKRARARAHKCVAPSTRKTAQTKGAH